MEELWKTQTGIAKEEDKQTEESAESRGGAKHRKNIC